MATKKRPPDRVLRRSAGPRQKLSPELEKLASGEEDRLHRPPPRPRIQDDRPGPAALVPGVKNRDARLVFDGRLRALEEALGAHPGDPAATEQLRSGLRETLATRLWRGRSLTSFEAMVEQLLGLGAADARALAGPVEPHSEEAVAVWMRAQAALLEAGLDAEVRIARDGARERFVLEASVPDAPEAASLLARGLGQLRGDLGRR